LLDKITENLASKKIKEERSFVPIVEYVNEDLANLLESYEVEYDE